MFDWRATAEERAAELPGDDLIPETRRSSTHGIQIAAPPPHIWPWLVQMGCDRAGFYSYDRLDNGGQASADRILPELQGIRVGDVLPSRPGSAHGFEVLRLEPYSLFLLGAFLRIPQLEGLPWDASRPEAYVRATWAFVLREQAGGAATRLVVRARSIIRPRWLGLLVNAVMGPAHIVMQRKQLLTLRARAARPAS